MSRLQRAGYPRLLLEIPCSSLRRFESLRALGVLTSSSWGVSEVFRILGVLTSSIWDVLVTVPCRHRSQIFRFVSPPFGIVRRFPGRRALGWDFGESSGRYVRTVPRILPAQGKSSKPSRTVPRILLCPMLCALCPMLYALCSVLYALCPMFYALCSMLYALCSMP